jgi:hypothetical protein
MKPDDVGWKRPFQVPQTRFVMRSSSRIALIFIVAVVYWVTGGGRLFLSWW